MIRCHQYLRIDRTLIYNIEPIGLGTPFVESLTSYICRLSNYHCLTTGNFVSKLLAPYLNKYYITAIGGRGGNGFFDSSAGINGVGTLAQDFVNVLQKLNQRTDLEKLTLLYWSKVLPTRGLMRKKRVWCPACYQESIVNKTPIYDQLLWFLQEVESCSKHRISLVNTCKFCYKEQQILSRNTAPGYCQQCNKWLGINLDYNDAEVNNYCSSLIIGEMLIKSSSHQSRIYTREDVTQSIRHIYISIFNKNITYMSQVLAIPKTTLKYWINGINLIPVSGLLKICQTLRVQFNCFLQLEVTDSNLIREICKDTKYIPNRKRYNYEIIEKVLNNEIISNIPKSLTKVAELIGCDRKLLNKQFPIESRKIVDNYKSYIQRQKEQRVTNIKKELEWLHEYLKVNEISLGLNKLEEIINQKYLFKEVTIKEEWKSIILKNMKNS